ncbi:MAG: peptidoglycan-binding protein [Actinobacteria bacterium]|nr:peptidoglycan-binding protein [Actinomycetota bacterium]
MPVPPVPVGLPDGIEELASYVGQVACDPTAKPGVLALGRLLTATYPGTSFGIARICGSGRSEHYEGRAVDWMNSVRVPQQAAQADALIAWLFARDSTGRPDAMLRRLGIMYLIWNNRIWGGYSADRGWLPYRDCASHPEASYDTTCHRDHIHLSLSWSGAMARTSYWTGKVAVADYGPCRPADLNWAPPYRAPNPLWCPPYPQVTAAKDASAVLVGLTAYSGAVVRRGSTGPAVSAVQRAVDVTVDGVFGPRTEAAVVAFHRAQGLPVTGVVDAATWRALLRVAVRTPTPTPTAGGSSSPPAMADPLAQHRHLVLRYGARGEAVRSVQRALGVRPTSGWFGPITTATVARYQRVHRLPVTGVVDAGTWRTLGA